MKIVDGTLQRAPAVSSMSTGDRKGAKAEAAAGSGVAMNMTPEFTRVRPVLYQAAWETMVEASKFDADDNGDIAPAFVQVNRSLWDEYGMDGSWNGLCRCQSVDDSYG